MSIWTKLKCGYFDGEKFCPKKFETQYNWERALQEAKTYGWSVNADGDIRCADHRDAVSEPFPWKGES